MTKTAIQQLLEYWRNDELKFESEIEDKMIELLATEKEQIKNAFEDGWEASDAEPSAIRHLNSESYYNAIYNQSLKSK